jgi:mannose-6-phosphate isomerase-like protein (cupin superfamily)
MNKYDVAKIRSTFDSLSERANEPLGKFNDCAIGIGRFIPGSSPWEKHTNGDELLLVTDGEVEIEVLEDSGESWRETLEKGSLFVVPKGKWHQLTAKDNISILYVSPNEDGAERMREHPLQGTDA